MKEIDYCETAHYSYLQAFKIMIFEWIPSDFYSTFLALWSSISTVFVQIFVGEHVFLRNVSSAKRLATCIAILALNITFYTFNSAVFLFVPSGPRYLAPAV